MQPFAEPVAELTAVLAFEPDATCTAELERSLAGKWGLAAVEQVAVAGGNGTARMHLFAHAVNNSLLPAAAEFRTRYGVKSLADKGARTSRFGITERQCRHDPMEAIGEVEEILARMRREPGDALVELLGFADGMRTIFDASDSALPRERPKYFQKIKCLGR